MKYEIRNIHIDLTEDVWGDGQKHGTNTVTAYPYDLEEDDPVELVKAVMDHFNLEDDKEAVRYNKHGKILIEYTTADMNHLTPISDSELVDWQAGKIKAWCVYATIQVYEVKKPEEFHVPGYSLTDET